jgi:hypothetical protein
MEPANQVRDTITDVGWDKHYLNLEDVAVVVRRLDGSFTLDRQRFPAASSLLGCTAVAFLAGLVLGAPHHRRHGRGRWHGRRLGLGRDRGRLHRGGAGADEARDVCHFCPGQRAGHGRDTALDSWPGRDVLKTNVDLERAPLIQSTLAAPPVRARNRTASRAACQTLRPRDCEGHTV